MNKKEDNLEKKYLSENKRWYWRDPEHARALQRAKYKRYPEKIKAGNKAWQEKNRDHFNTLIRFGNAIYAAKKKGNYAKESMLRAARESYKKMHREQKLKAI